MAIKLLWISMLILMLACSDMGSDTSFGPKLNSEENIIINGAFVGDTTIVSLILINSGDEKLLIWDFHISGNDSSNFYFEPQISDTITILPDSVDSLTLYHVPSTSGINSATIEFKSNVEGDEVVSYSITANVNIIPTSYINNVQPIFDSNCSGCHGSSGGLNLSSYDNLMLGNSNNGPVIISGNSIDSYLIRKLNGNNITGSPMPLGGSITSEQISTIATWIDEGANDN